MSVPSGLPPEAIVMQMVMGGWVSKVISDITRLNVPDLLERHGACTARELTTRHGLEADPEFLERALRACASVRLVTESADGRFGPTPLSRALTRDSPAGIKALVEVFGGMWWKVWAGLGDAIRTGEPQTEAILGLDWWSWLASHPADMEEFGEAMKANSIASLNGVLRHCDLSGASVVVDVGGGFGHLAVALLQKYPHLRATVLDAPDVVKAAPQRLGLADPSLRSRLSYQGGNMFDAVPPGDTYVLKHIVHDWDDARCERLLSLCRAGLTADDKAGRVICVDAVLPPMGDVSGTAAKLLDLDMMVFIPGKERTRAQWERLYRAAGLEIVSVTPLQDNFGTSIIEGREA